jgi:hypothetical protein
VLQARHPGIVTVTGCCIQNKKGPAHRYHPSRVTRFCILDIGRSGVELLAKAGPKAIKCSRRDIPVDRTGGDHTEQ